MGRRGPQKTPTKILELHGSWRAKGRKGEPQAQVCVPETPDWLLEEAKPVFERLAGELAQVGVMTNLDVTMLGMTCDAWAQYISARDQVTIQGPVCFTENGNEYQSPHVGMMNKAWERVVKGCQTLGLSPSSRAGLTVGATPKPKLKPNDKTRLFKLG